MTIDYASLPFLDTLTAKVAHVHGEHDPRLHEVRHAFLQFVEAVEDDDAGASAAALGRMRELTDGYTAPDWACTSYRKLLVQLRELEGSTVLQEHAPA